MNEFDSRLTREDFEQLNQVIREAEEEEEEIEFLTVECGTGETGRKTQAHLIYVYGTSGMIEKGILVKGEKRTFVSLTTGAFSKVTRYRVEFSLKDAREI